MSDTPTEYGTVRHGVAYSVAYEEAMGSVPIDYVMLETFELRHSGFRQDGLLFVPRIVNNFENIQARLENDAPANPGEYVRFVAMPVSVGGLDETDSSQAPALSVSFDGVSPLIVEQLDYALNGIEPIFMTVRVYASNDLSAPAFKPVIHLTLRDVTVTETKVTTNATFYDPSNRAFPKETYTSARYPGLTQK